MSYVSHSLKKWIPILLALSALSGDAVFLTGCATAARKKPGAEPGPVQPIFVGTVTLVNTNLGFVLIEATPVFMPEAGQALKCKSNGVDSAIVTVGVERKRPFISADIVKGMPQKGDEVFQ